MAALDFPASPTSNQTFVASNGVTYRWLTPPGIWIAVTEGNAFASDTPPASPVDNQLWFNAAQAALYIYYNDGNSSQWVPASPSVTAVTSPGGDFMVQNSANVVVGATLTTVLWDTVITGNSGGWYNPATGRYTPPAGRYFIQATMGMGANATSQSTADIYIRKNGVQIARGGNVPSTAGWWADSAAAVVIDANGSDYFDVQIQFNVAGAYMQATAGKFLAFPISGVKGPPGDPYPGTVGGDFFASIGAGMAITGTPATVLFPTVQTGNSGGWYSPATGRFIPPQGRYNIFAQVYNNGANNTGSVQLYKNGVAVPGAYSAGFNAAGSQTGTISAVVDANGTDYFDIRVWGNNAATVQQGGFGGYPITGVKGPPGDPGPGALALYSEKVCVGGETFMDVTIPPNCKRIELEYSIQAAAGDPTTLLQAMQSGVPNATASYSYVDGYAIATPASGGGGLNSQTAWNFNGARWNSGTVKLWAHPSGQWTGTSLRAEIYYASGQRYVYYSGLDGPAIIPTTTGWRLSLGASSFLAGSFLRCYVVT